MNVGTSGIAGERFCPVTRSPLAARRQHTV
jgi:hypothetical protein